MIDFWLEHFIPFIQFVGAINIVYIATHFPTKVYELIFNKDKIESELSELRDKIHAGAGAVEAMGVMTMANGKTNEAGVVELKRDYRALSDEWNAKHDEINCEIETARNVKGAKSLFLNITLYCILILLDIAAFSITEYEFFRLSIVTLNVATAISAIYFSRIIWGHRWDGKRNNDCYRSTFKFFMVQVVVSLLFPAVCLVLQMLSAAKWGINWSVPDCVCDPILLLCIFLPIYPCLASVIFIFSHEAKINDLKESISNDFIGKQKELDERKKKFEEIDQMFTKPDEVTFRQQMPKVLRRKR